MVESSKGYLNLEFWTLISLNLVRCATCCICSVRGVYFWIVQMPLDSLGLGGVGIRYIVVFLRPVSCSILDGFCRVVYIVYE